MKRFSIPLTILLVILLSYGLQINRMGFYWDDWTYIFNFQNLGVLHTHLLPSRPAADFAQLPGFLFSGTSPLRWQIFNLFLIWALSLMLWRTLTKLWPHERTLNAFIAILFPIYPVFSQQNMAVTYTVNFMGFLLFLISIYAMVTSLQEENQSRLWTAIGLGAVLLQEFTIEYFIGLELIRPILIWFNLNVRNTKEKLTKTLKIWLPYILAVVLYTIWRIFYGDPNQGFGEETVLSSLYQQPLGTILDQIQIVIRDLITIFIGGWHKTVDISIVDFSVPFNIASIAVSLFAFGAITWAATHWFPVEENDYSGKTKILDQFILVGFFAAIFGFIPSWSIGKEISGGLFNDRYGLAPSLGASIFLVGIIGRFIGENLRQKVLLLSILVSLAVGFHIRAANDYRWDWVRQTRFFNQLNWRMPGIDANTSIIMNRAISTFLNNYPARTALNAVLDVQGYPSELPYWLENYSGSPIAFNWNRFLNGRSFSFTYKVYSFKIDRTNTIVIYHDPEKCLKVLAPNDLNNFLVPEEYRVLGEISNMSQIDPKGANTDLPKEIFGEEQEIYWCYYYQKADLARQQDDWEEMITYLDEAESKGITSDDEGEYIQFVQAYGMLGDWEKALSLSQELYEKDPESTFAGLCFIWGDFKAQFSQDVEFTPAYESMVQLIDCQE